MAKIETDGKGMKKPTIQLKRAYDPVDSTDGTRFLVERHTGDFAQTCPSGG